MGKTRKRIPYSCFRRPKGWKQAKANGARYGSIPPNAWDDLPHCHSIAVFWDLLRQLDDEGYHWDDIAEKLSKKYKVSKSRILRELHIQNHRRWIWEQCCPTFKCIY